MRKCVLKGVFVRILPVVYLMLCGSVEYVCGLSMSRSSKSNLHKKINASNDQIGKPTFVSDRRGMFLGVGSSLIFWGVSSPPSLATGEDIGEGFRSGGYGKEEYSNAFTASRDTNISPKEAYDSINSSYVASPVKAAIASDRIPRALDVGAGAGVSTQFLWNLGYRTIDAVDWSGDAWDRFVTNDPTSRCPSSVKFYELDDERFRTLWRDQKLDKYDTIVFNFAVNDSKAKSFANELLLDENSILLAPVNTQQDYWLKQAYKCYDKKGNLLWQATDVGAWSVQFQPDVTQDTCQGIWCAPFNGFKKMGSESSSLW